MIEACGAELRDAVIALVARTAGSITSSPGHVRSCPKTSAAAGTTGRAEMARRQSGLQAISAARSEWFMRAVTEMHEACIGAS